LNDRINSLTGPPTTPLRYQDRLGEPFILTRNATIGPKGKAIAYGETEEIRPVRRVYTLADAPIFDAVLQALVANPAARKHVIDSYRAARADRSLTPDTAADLLATAVAAMRALSLPEARKLVDARAARALAPGSDVLAPKGKAGARAAENAARKAAVRRLSHHRT
jgi:hypothetical protein